MCTTVGLGKKITVQQRNRDEWYGRPESMLAQTSQKLQKQERKPIFFFFKYPKIFPGTLETSPVWSPILLWWEIPLQTSI
jgi:hypothetical protein